MLSMNKKCHEDLRYLKLLAKNFPTITSASTEIINLQAILNLPKGTEHYISDIHGEYESFTHIINNASGVIKRKIEDTFKNTISVKGKESLATLIYYPEEKLEKIKLQENNLDDWYKLTLYRLVELLKTISSKYTRSKVRKSLPKDFSYIIEELLHEQGNYENKEAYYNGIINTIIEIKLADKFIISICNVIQQLAIDRLHIVGDIYDRGPGAEIIMDKLMNFHSIDIEWGNHDILWMGAASGSYALVANALRIALKYGNLFTVEEGYGINLLPLATFSIETYKNDNCSNFIPLQTNGEINKIDISLIAKMHKAISIIQFKLEGAIIKKHPEFDMENRKLLHRINYDDKSIDIDGKIYKLTDVNFPTIDKNNPYALTEQEEILIRRLSHNFKISERLQKHVKFLYNNGGMYKIYNSNLLFHGCMILDNDGDFKDVPLGNKHFKGKELFDILDKYVRDAYFCKENQYKDFCLDIMWFLWCGKNSPQFGKLKMSTFERYFIEDESSYLEGKIPYYKYRNEESTADKILNEFGLIPNSSHIINGHIPVKTKNGENPVKAGGKIIVIDGGFCKAYQPKTGIAGYTLIYNSYGILLTSQQPFVSTEIAITEDKDMIFSSKIIKKSSKRITVADTDIGKELQEQINNLFKLVNLYYNNTINEKF